MRVFSGMLTRADLLARLQALARKHEQHGRLTITRSWYAAQASPTSASNLRMVFLLFPVIRDAALMPTPSERAFRICTRSWVESLFMLLAP